MSSSSSIYTYVNWLQVLKALNVSVPSAVLPTRVRCPLCRKNSMDILPDCVRDSAWFHCTSCGQYGGILELLAKVLKTDIASAVHILIQSGVDIPLTQSMLDNALSQLTRFKRAHKFWKLASAGSLHNSKTCQTLIQEKGIYPIQSQDRREKGTDQLAGCARRKEVEAAFFPTCCARAVYGSNDSKHRIFKGRNWGDVLAIPFYDLPGRIATFLFIGREGKYPEDYRIYKAGPKKPQHAEMGLAYHPNVLQACRDWANTLLVTHDVFGYLQLQSRHFEESLIPLPLACYLDGHNTAGTAGHTKHAYGMFHRQKIVLWLHKLNVQGLRQIKASKSSVVFAGPTVEHRTMSQFLARFSPRDLVRRLQKQAKPWRTALKQYCEKLSSSELASLLEEIRLEDPSCIQVLEDAGIREDNRMGQIMQEQNFPKRVTLPGGDAVERDGQWWKLRKNLPDTMLCSAILRIEQIVKQGEKVFYKGKILVENKSLEFFDVQGNVERGGFRWMQQQAIKQGNTIIQYSGAYTHAVRIAIAFHTPQVVEGLQHVGWHEERMRFIFPNFSLTPQEGFTEPESHLHYTKKSRVHNLQPATGISPEELTSPENSEHAKVYWSLILYNLANIIAPVFNRQQVPIGVHGPLADDASKKIAEALCFEKVSVTSERSEQIDPSEQWPVIVSNPTVKGRRSAWYSLSDERNCVSYMRERRANLVALLGGWHIVHTHSCDEFPIEWAVRARAVVLNYMADLCKRKLVLHAKEGGSSSWLEELCYDLCRFVENHGVSSEALSEAVAASWPDNGCGHAMALAELLNDALRCGFLVPRIEGYGNGGHGELVRRPGEYVYLRRDTLGRFCRDVATNVPSIERVAAALADADALVGTDENGWYIDEKWWADVHADQFNQLRLVNE